MIRVLQYIGSLEQGGSQAMIMNIYRNIDRTKIQFDFVIHAGGITPLAEEAQSMGANIYTCPAYKISTAKAYSQWWKKFFREHAEYKIVHSHVRSTAAIVLKIAKKYGCKTIAHAHSTSSGKGIESVIKNIFQYGIRYVADCFMACSQTSGQWLYGKKIFESDRFFYIPNAIDAAKYAYDENISKNIRAELGYSDDDYVIGHLGRFSEPKNHMLLLDIFAELYKKSNAYKLLLVGDGELRDNIEEKIRKLKLESAVRLTGVRSDANRLLMAMDLFLFPSKWEGVPLSVVEAQASGLPCVVSSSVTKDVCITDIITQIDLDAPMDLWINAVNKYKGMNRCSRIDDIIRAKYDVYESSMWLSDFYERLSDE